ncbi:MAG: protease modulator HflC [Muricoprocola sp.]
MKNKKLIIGGIAALVVAAAACMSIVITNKDEYTVVRQFGKIVKIVEEPGISFKVPIIQETSVLPNKIMIYDLAPSDVITKEKKTMISDSYVLWKISDPLKFAQTLNSSMVNAENRINTVVYNSTKNTIGRLTQDELISGRAGVLSDAVVEGIGDNLDQYGIELLMFETKQLDLPDDNKESVYERMISERNNIAATYTAEGNSEAKVIRNTTDKEVAIQISEANKQAEILVAEGEAEYMRILAEAYSDEDKTDFYSYVRSLDALKNSMTGEQKTLVLPSESPIAQAFVGN